MASITGLAEGFKSHGEMGLRYADEVENLQNFLAELQGRPLNGRHAKELMNECRADIKNKIFKMKVISKILELTQNGVIEALTERGHTQWLTTSYTKLVDEGLQIESGEKMKEFEGFFSEISKVLEGLCEPE